jgi:hypothetical protein
MRTAWDVVEMAIEDGIVDAVGSRSIELSTGDALREQAARMGRALAAGDVEGVLAVDWTTIRTSALRGIRSKFLAGTITREVAASWTSILMQFNAAWARLGR